MFDFLRRHVIAGMGLFVGPVITIGGLILHAHDLTTLMPTAYLAALGLLIFFLSVIGVLARWHQEGLPAPMREAYASARQGSSSVGPPIVGNLRRQRIIVDVSPKYLMDMVKDKMSTEAERLSLPYIGKWIKMSAVVDNVSCSQYSSSIRTAMRDENGSHDFQFGATWNDRLELLIKGQSVNIIGKIEEVRNYGLTLVECELE